MGASELALSALAFLLTYAIHSTLLLGLACVLAPRVARSLALRERVWKTAMFGGLVTALVQVGVSMETPLFHWTLAADQAVLEPAERQTTPRSELGSTPSEPLTAREATGAAPQLFEAPQPSAPTSLAAPHTTGASPRPRIDRHLESALAAVDAPASSVTSPVAPHASAPAIAERYEVVPSRASLAADDAPRSAWLSSVVDRWREWTARGLLLWAVFALFVVALFAQMCVRLARRMRGRKELEGGPLREALDRLIPQAFPAGRHVRLYVAPDLRAPVSFGFVRASICVPPRALLELSAEEQESMLAHELAHLMRRDPLWLSLAWLVERVFFFQPLHRIARAELHDVAELACDEWAARRTGNRLALASCLARIAEWIIGAPRSLPATSMAEHHGRCRLTQRIERLLDDEQERTRDDELRRWLAPAAAAGLGVLVLVAPGVSAPSAARITASLEVSAGSLESDSQGAQSELDLANDLAEPVEDTCDSTDASQEEAPPDQALLGGAVAGVSAPDAVERAQLSEELAKLSSSLSLLRTELAPLREQADALASDPQLVRALGSIQRRADSLERRAEALTQLIQVLETLESMPAHPSSTSSGFQGSRSLP